MIGWGAELMRNVLGIAVVIGMLAMAAASTGEAGSSAPVRVELTASGSCRLGETLTLDVRLQNVSDDRLTVYGGLRWGHIGGLVMRVVDASGADVQPKDQDDDLIPPSTLKDPSSFVTLQERHSLGVRRVERAVDLFGKRGTYTVWVEYVSPVPQSFAVGENFISREAGKFISNRVKIVIQ